MEPYYDAPFGQTNAQESAQTLTKREYFATQIAVGLMANTSEEAFVLGKFKLIESSVKLADHLIKTLNSPEAK